MCFPPGWLTFIRTSASQTLCKTVAVGQPRLSRQRLCFNQWPRPARPPTGRAAVPSSETPEGGLCLCFAATVRRQSGEPPAPAGPGPHHRRASPPSASGPTASPSMAGADTELSEPAAVRPRCSPAQQAEPPMWAPPGGSPVSEMLLGPQGPAPRADPGLLPQRPRASPRGQQRAAQERSGSSGTAPRAARAPGCTLHADPTFQ